MEMHSVKECRRVKLPEAFELPRRFGVSWGCLREGAFNGLDAVVVEAGAKGARLRYALPYDAKARRYVETYKPRTWRKWGGFSQAMADALYELADRRQVEIHFERICIGGRIACHWEPYAVVDGVKFGKYFCGSGWTMEQCIEEIERWIRIEEERRSREAERRKTVLDYLKAMART